jgi:hypothetical protein
MDRSEELIDLGTATVETKGQGGEHLDSTLGHMLGFTLADE